MAIGGVGISVQRKDAYDKVNGLTKYNIDYSDPQLLHAKILTSSYAHAKIIAIDITRAQNVPGVKAVITGNAHIEQKKQ